MIYVDDDLQALDLKAALAAMSEQRREQTLRFSHEAGQRQSAAAYELLRRGLRELYGVEEPPVFEYDEGGKPRLAGRADIHFNLSHCRVAAACAVDSRPVGIDIETIRPLKEQLMRYTMNDDEVDCIMRDERPEVAFTRLWTMKEARLKLSGQGIRTDLKEVLTGSKCRFETVVCLERGYVYTLCTD